MNWGKTFVYPGAIKEGAKASGKFDGRTTYKANFSPEKEMSNQKKAEKSADVNKKAEFVSKMRAGHLSMYSKNEKF